MASGPSHGVIPALDVATLDDALRLVEKTTGIDGITGYKISQSTVLRTGLAAAVDTLRGATGHPLYYDHQKAGLDVPSNGPAFASAAASTGVDGLILFPVAGPTAVREFVRGALEQGVAPLVGAALPLPDFFLSGGGWVADDVLLRVAELAVGHGARDIVVPAHEPERIREVTTALSGTSEELTFFLPGIGALGGTIPEAFGAVRGTRAHAIVGRAVHAASDPAEAARRLCGQALEFAA
ncbi:orotidine 5'-phosphate decarboxylase / HUMPS family protein [Streptomyces tremellae]|uniref:Orotidine 5'-phosphate decarboxylase domain-containing protein n=1 Tax=Streptomyces tremellae TaxID=1124239 RepID=A0ABP7G6T6_9ACTN